MTPIEEIRAALAAYDTARMYYYCALESGDYSARELAWGKMKDAEKLLCAHPPTSIRTLLAEIDRLTKDYLTLGQMAEANEIRRSQQDRARELAEQQRDDWRKCAEGLAEALRLADASNSNSHYWASDDGRPKSESALRRFNELNKP